MICVTLREIKWIVLFSLQRQSRAGSDLASAWTLPQVTACCEGKTCIIIDKMGEKSWDCWAPGGPKQAPGLAKIQVLQDKTNSINMKAGLQFGHRLMVIISLLPSWDYSLEGLMAEAEIPILWPPDVKNWFIGKDPDAGRDWGQEEKGTTEDEMVGWHHRLYGHEFE